MPNASLPLQLYKHSFGITTSFSPDFVPKKAFNFGCNLVCVLLAFGCKWPKVNNAQADIWTAWVWLLLERAIHHLIYTVYSIQQYSIQQNNTTPWAQLQLLLFITTAIYHLLHVHALLFIFQKYKVWPNLCVYYICVKLWQLRLGVCQEN